MNVVGPTVEAHAGRGKGIEMDHEVSRDGTRIAYEVSGQGPAILLVPGATADHTTWLTVAPLFARDFTVLAMDRRGYGESGDAPAYAIEREFEDVTAVVEAVGEPVDVVGHSFGGLCALEASWRTPHIRRLVLYEPATGADTAALDRLAPIETLLAAGEREAALISFYRDMVGLSPDEVEYARSQPAWSRRVEAAPTVVREMRALVGYAFDRDRLKAVTVPTLLLEGEHAPDWARASIEVVRGALPQSERVTIPGQGHAAQRMAPELFHREVAGFLSSQNK